MKIAIPTLCLFGMMTACAQEAVSVKEKISDAFLDYFDLDRENLYVNTDKNVLFNNEDVWFKGYSFNKKNGTPFFETTNVYAELLDDSGKKIEEELLFAYLGVFSGHFKIQEQWPAGRYYLRFYTNWMNNFGEDESATYALQVISPTATSVPNFLASDEKSVQISVQPEGGTLVQDAIASLGIHTTDCLGNPVKGNGKITDAAGQVVANFIVGDNGYGKVSFTPGAGTYTAIFESGSGTFSTTIHALASTGVNLEVNNYALPGKVLIRLHTNAKSVRGFDGHTLNVVIQQNNKTNIFEAVMDAEQKDIMLPDENFFPGINTIRIIDDGMEELAARQIYQPVQVISGVPLEVLPATGGNIKIIGHTQSGNADLSVTVLPDGNRDIMPRDDIRTGLLLDPYLKVHPAGISGLINDSSKAKRYLLDLVMMAQPESKYHWQDILAGPAKQSYDFDIGLTVKGTINESIGDRKKYRVQLVSPKAMIKDYAEINGQNQFEFKNLVFGKLSSFEFTLLKNPWTPVKTTIVYQVANLKRRFNRPFRPEPPACAPQQLTLDVPKFSADVVQLENVDVESDPKKLKYQGRFGNSNLSGYKIDSLDYHTPLLTFIEQHGFKVSQSFGTVSITGRHRTTINGAVTTPEIYINSRQLTTVDELADIRMDEVDEIYLNPNAVVASMNNHSGIIKIYMKKLDSGSGSLAKSFENKEGFASIDAFQNAPYIFNSPGFRNFGIIHWQADVSADETGTYTVELPDPGLKTFRVIVDGLTPDGKIIHEDQVLNF